MKLNIKINKAEDIFNISGTMDENLMVLKNIFKTDISVYKDEIFTSTEDEGIINKLEELLDMLLSISKLNVNITPRDIMYLSALQKEGYLNSAYSLYKKPLIIAKNTSGKIIVPKTLNQRKYLDLLKSKTIVFGVGPAGVGKTYLAVAYATSLLKDGIVKKIILTRPAVEAGESLGYLPGDLKEKIDPYLRPLYDALYDLLGMESSNSLIEKNIIEIAPLAYMRGRTLEQAVVILDEAQNATNKQMMMFLTRLGLNSKMIITGDITQIDLPHGQKSGLKIAANILNDINDIGIMHFTNIDVVRNPIVQAILDRYQNSEKE